LFTWSKDTIGDATLFDLEITWYKLHWNCGPTAEVSENEYTQNKELAKTLNISGEWGLRTIAKMVFSSTSSFTTGSSACFTEWE
jgi:hypothetical protein